MSSKVIVLLDSGLGNQLFMIFTGMSKAIDENKEFCIYPTGYNYPRGHYFSNLFKTLIPNVEKHELNTNNRFGYNELNFHYDPIPRDAEIIKGYFQSPKYFNHNKDKIIKKLELEKLQDKYQFNFNAVSLHFRFNDFIWQQRTYILLKPSYYINAINKLAELIPNLFKDYKFIVFCQKEDNELVEDYINEISNHFNNQIKFIKSYEINPNITDYQELLFMSSCQHFINANSSFSWFGSYLSRNTNKKVIYPNEWFGSNLKSNSLKDIALDEWIKVNIH